MKFGKAFQLSTVLALPSPGDQGRMAFLTDDMTVYVDTGTEWFPLNRTKQESVSATTGTLAAGARTALTIPGVGKHCIITRITVSAVSWVVIYNSETSRVADTGRLITTDPVPASGVIGEVLLDNMVKPYLDLSPPFIYYNNEGPRTSDLICSVKNYDVISNEIEVTLTRLILEN